jgi:hypothetical protein
MKYGYFRKMENLLINIIRRKKMMSYYHHFFIYFFLFFRHLFYLSYINKYIYTRATSLFDVLALFFSIFVELFLSKMFL